MKEYFTRWNDWLGRRMFFVVLSALLSGFLFSIPNSPVWNTASVALFAYMTFITAQDTSFRNFIHVLARPWVTIWMLLLIHGVMPLVAWGIGMLFYPDNLLTRLGFIVAACIPIGVTSVIWTSLTRGNVALSMVAVTMDTLVSPFLLPVFIAVMAGQTVHINYTQMLVGLLFMVTIPSLLAMAINDLSHGGLASFSRSVGGFTSKVALFLVIFINSSIVAQEMNWDTSLVKMLLVILLLSICGYYLGYAGSYALKDRHRDTVVAMIYIVGMRNIAFGSVLAVTYFPPAVAVPVTLGMLYQQPLAAAVSSLINRFNRLGGVETPKQPEGGAS